MLDPMRDPTWDADFQTHDPEEFLRVLHMSEKCALFVDESGDAIGKYAREMSTVTTKSRHFGHRAHLLCQRAVQIDRTVRGQCTEIYLFAVDTEDAKTMALEYRSKTYLQAAEFPAGMCVHGGKFMQPQIIKVF